MPRARFALLALLLCASTMPAAAGDAIVPRVSITKSGVANTVVVPSGTGAISSPNVEMLATIPDTGATGGRFVGNYFIMTGSAPYPLVPGPTAGVRIFDASLPETPVLIGTLPLPHAENEDVDVSASRKLILVSQDNVSTSAGGALFVVDWSIPNAPVLRGVLRYPASVTHNGRAVGGPGHIASCIADCARYAWVGGARDGSIFVIDLQNPATPSIAGRITQTQNPAGQPNAVFRTGIVHDVNVEPGTNNVWVTGSGGTTMLDATNPLSPVLRYRVTSADNGTWNQFIHHNSLRFDAQTVLITEEDWQKPNCGGGDGATQGGFQTWRVPATGQNLTHLDQFTTEMTAYTEGRAPVIQYCSSHWFTFNAKKVVAVGWYNQGVRFLDISNPGDIRQVGYWLGPASMASGAYFVPGRDDLVYAVDYQRGLDIVRIANGGAASPAVVAPLRAEWLTNARTEIAFEPHPVFGFACARPA